MVRKFLGVEVLRPTSTRATYLGALSAIALIALLYWAQAWGFDVDLTVKVLLSVSVVWAYVTTLFGIRVTKGWRPCAFYLGGLIVVNVTAWEC